MFRLTLTPMLILSILLTPLTLYASDVKTEIEENLETYIEKYKIEEHNINGNPCKKSVDPSDPENEEKWLFGCHFTDPTVGLAMSNKIMDKNTIGNPEEEQEDLLRCVATFGENQDGEALYRVCNLEEISVIFKYLEEEGVILKGW